MTQEISGVRLQNHSSRRPTTVLVIEDEEMVRRSISAMLGVYGLEVLGAGNGKEGVLAYQESQGDIDVVLLDMTLPGISGPEVVKRLRQIDPDVRVIVTSGYSIHSVVEQFPNEPDLLFIQKPSPTIEIVAKILEAKAR